MHWIAKRLRLGLLAAVCTAAPVFFAACAQADVDSMPAFSVQDRCASCGMAITRYPGPKGVVVTVDGDVHKYCSTRGAACGVLDLGRENVAHVWMHDAAKAEWIRPDDSYLIEAQNAWFVYGSSRKAVMGPSLAAFADRSEAEKFQSVYGGKLHRLEELTREVLGCKAKY